MRSVAALALVFALISEAKADITIYRLMIVCKFDKEQYCKDIPYKYVHQLRECLAKHEGSPSPVPGSLQGSEVGGSVFFVEACFDEGG